MESQWSELGFAGAVSQSRSIQGLARVLKLYAARHPGPCELRMKMSGEGVEIDFGSGQAGAATGLDDFLRYLQQTDELMLLEAMVAILRDRRADEALIESLIEEAHELVAVLYPDARIVGKESHG